MGSPSRGRARLRWASSPARLRIAAPWRRSAIAIAVGWIPAGCAYSLVAGGELRPEPFERLVERTSAVRGSRTPASLDARVIRRRDIPPLLQGILRADWEPGQLADYQDGLVAVGLWPPERDLTEELTAVGGDEIAGLYVPASRALYVVADPPTPISLRFASMLLQRDLVREIVLAHELVHLIQHRTSPAVFEAMKWRGQDDAISALQAALEGDATHFAFLAVMQGAPSPDPEQFREQLERETEQQSRGPLADAPGLIRLTLAFPYARGYPLSFAEGTELLDDPPCSTEQVLHAERRKADFWAIDLEHLDARLPPGCRGLGQNTLGELGISVLLRDLQAANPQAAADGWDGDRYLVARCQRGLELLWWSQWDSRSDAREFASAYAGIAAAVRERAQLPSLPSLHLDGKSVLVVTEGLAPLHSALEPRPRRGRVSSLGELRDHFALPGSGHP